MTIALAARCAVRVLQLLATSRLHANDARVGSTVTIPDGRRYVVFRETSCDAPSSGRPIVLSVWFRLRMIPPGALVRRWLFERLCIVNTLLFAGFPGYEVKLWMVDPVTSDYAGLYSWASADEADRYGRYITSVLAPFSVRDSLGYQVLPDVTLDEYLAPAPT